MKRLLSSLLFLIILPAFTIQKKDGLDHIDAYLNNKLLSGWTEDNRPIDISLTPPYKGDTLKFVATGDMDMGGAKIKITSSDKHLIEMVEPDKSSFEACARFSMGMQFLDTVHDTHLLIYLIQKGGQPYDTTQFCNLYISGK